MKTLKLKWYDKDKELEKWVDKKIAEMSSYLPIIIKHFYNMSWGPDTLRADGECIEDWPEVILQIQFNQGFHLEGMKYARVFWLELGTDNQDTFFVELEEYKKEYSGPRLASSDEKFKDWMEVVD